MVARAMERWKTLSVIGYVLACLILAVLVAISIGVLIETIKLETISPERIFLHRNLLLGFVAFSALFLIPRVQSNVRWLMKFSHEFTHLLFAILFFRKINRFKVDDTDSYVSYISGWFGYHAITLSPYCIPLFYLGPASLALYDGSPFVRLFNGNRCADRFYLCLPYLLLGKTDPPFPN